MPNIPLNNKKANNAIQKYKKNLLITINISLISLPLFVLYFIPFYNYVYKVL